MTLFLFVGIFGPALLLVGTAITEVVYFINDLTKGKNRA